MTPQTSYPEKRFYVYLLFREDGQPFYVGKGSNNRWKGHEKDAKYLDSYKDRIVRKMVADGHEIRRVKFADGLVESAAFFLESLLIKKIGRYPYGPLANATDGGEGVSNPSPEVRAKIGAANKGNKYAVGHKSTPKQIEALAKGRIKSRYTRESSDKIAQKLTGRKLTPEHKAKISEGLKGKVVISEEARRKIGIAHRRENMNPESLRSNSEKNRGQIRSVEAREKMRASRLRFIEEHNTPEDIEMRRKSASKAALERWRVKKLKKQ